MTSSVLRAVAQHPVATFMVIGLGAAFLVGAIPPIVDAQVLPFDLPLYEVVGTVLGVGLGAFLVTYALSGRAGVADLARRSVRWRVPLRWYLIAVLTVPVGATLISLVIYGADALAAPPGGWPRALAEVAAVFLLQLVLLQLAEEIGFTGFLQHHWQDRYHPMKLTVYVALLWALWHVPDHFAEEGWGVEQLIAAPVVFAIGFVSLFFARVLLVFLYNRTVSSVLLMAIFHASFDASISQLSDDVVPGSNTARFLIFSGLIVALAIAVIIATRGQLGRRGVDADTTGATGRVTASMYYRNGQGRRRRIEATADSKTAAHREAVQAFEQAMASAGGLGYSKRTTFRDLAGEWFERFEQLVRAGRRSPASASLYRSTLDRHVLPVIGGLRLTELTTSRIDAFLHGVLRDKGHATAKVCRSVVSGVCGLAVRRDGLRSNPVRDVGDLERGDQAGARALSPEECREWLAILDADPHAVRKDLPDLARFLLGTGVRIGEAMGVTWDDVDLPKQIVHIRRTVIRVKGVGLVAKATKSRAGLRTLRIPAWLVAILAARRPKGGGPVPVFPDAAGGFRDRNNIERDFRQVRAGTPFEWVVPHTYRKTVATFLDDEGLSARIVADQLGHARISMTQDVYMGRKAVDRAAVSALEGLSE